MKNISSELKNHLAQDVTTIATCWKITLTNSNIIGFTDHDVNIDFQSVIYKHDDGLQSQKLNANSEIGKDVCQITGILNHDDITNQDILAGIYDYAKVEIFQLNYNDLSQGKLIICDGYFGEITMQDNVFSTEIKTISQQLSNTIGDIYSPLCRAVLGDSNCQVDLTTFTVTGSVSSLTSNSEFVDTARSEQNGYFNFGKITFTSGANAGLSMEVKNYRDNIITLSLPMAYDISIGDNYSMISGCDKNFLTCKNRFNNVVNFRGEPNIPTMDTILKTAATR